MGTYLFDSDLPCIHAKISSGAQGGSSCWVGEEEQVGKKSFQRRGEQQRWDHMWIGVPDSKSRSHKTWLIKNKNNFKTATAEH